MSKALELATNNENFENYNKKLLKYRNLFIDKVTNNLENVRINGDLEKRLPGNVNISIKGVDSQTLLTMLDMEGICASSGSACNSNIITPSHVLTAIGLDKETANSTLRFTFGNSNTLEDVEYISETLIKIVNKLRKNI